MRGFEAHVRNDVALLHRDFLFILAMVLTLALFVIIAFVHSSMYAENASWATMDIEEVKNQQQSIIHQYWMSIMGVESLVILLFSVLIFAVENETGTFALTLTYGVKPWQVHLSKILVMTVIGAMLSIISLIFFIIIFSSMNELFVSLPELLSSAIFPMLFSTTIASLGLFVSVLFRKKNSAVVVSLIILFSMQATFSFGMSIGYNDALQDLSAESTYFDITNEDIRDSFPQHMKLLLSLNPFVIQEGLIHTTVDSQEILGNAGRQYFTLMDIWGDLALGLSMILSLNILSIIALNRRYTVRHVKYEEPM